MKKIKIGNSELSVKLALTPKQQAQGLMDIQGKGPQKLGKDHGMLFVYQKERLLSFWIKNTSIPLSIAFIDKDNKIIQIEHLKPNSTASVKSQRPAMYALEVNHNWFKENKIKIGDIVQIPKSRKIKISIVKLPPEAKKLAKKIEDKLVDMTVKALKSKLSVDQLNNLNIDVEVEE
tara:strand:- start:561 stop:1088 length:528 start_codon:yes stop_codon:yes gene_type:complete